MKEKEKKIQFILNGKDKNVKKVENMLPKLLMEMIINCRNKEGEEQTGIINFYYMEIVEIIRKAAAIGYNEAYFDIKERK